ncbi:MAG: hypothetical protein HYZ57_20030 [Acidobacteria bacterium]|nr:hypothetical protein [Acidobacteriota bacterium]
MRISAVDARGWFGMVGELVSGLHCRCRDCGARFRRGFGMFANLLYAKCPRCYGLTLTKWDLAHYNPPGHWRVLLKMGAKARRCNRCRCNFVSLRPAKTMRRPSPVQVPAA